VTCTQSTADFLCVVGPISQYAIGRDRGRPRGPCNGGTASSSGNAWVESWQFAPVSSIANGTPRPSQIKWRLLPRLARSVGFAPVLNGSHRTTINNRMGPVDLAITRKPIQQHEVSQVPNFRLAADRVNAANKSCQNRNPIVSAASARECHFGVRTKYP
jgi:hypothetical protein